MSYSMLKEELKLQDGVFSINRIQGLPAESENLKFSCITKIFSHVAQQGAVLLKPGIITCPGANTGCGFRDGIPNIPGGFGNFIAQGAGEGFPEGERIKCGGEIAEMMINLQPQGVMEGFSAIRVAPYMEGEAAEVVTMLLNPDQFSAMLHLFYYRKATYDDVMVPIASGCAQLFRLPFGELGKSNPKAVMGNTDFVSRPFLPKDVFSFTVPGEVFLKMCADAPESFLISTGWKPVKERL